MKRSFSRVAIVNRGEAALRFIHAALELNREGERLHTIALFTEPDRNALFVREADEAWDLGPAMVEGPDGRRKVAYTDLSRLEYGAEIGRAVVNFRGPIVFCVVSRYHGGAFVVFSNALNENLSVVALEGTYASVIGGAPAAAVVFSREVEKRTAADPRVREPEAEVAAARGHEKARLRARLREVTRAVHSEKLGQVADEYDGIHTVERARRVGSVHEIIPAARLRPHLIEKLEKGIARELMLSRGAPRVTDPSAAAGWRGMPAPRG